MSRRESVIGYTRAGARISVAEEQAVIAAACRTHGWKLVRVEADQAGEGKRSRPALARALAALHAGDACADAGAGKNTGDAAESCRANRREDHKPARPGQEPASDRRGAQPAPHTDRARRGQMATQLGRLRAQPGLLS